MQQVKKTINGDEGKSQKHIVNRWLPKRALSVTELDIDLIDSINPFEEAYAILAKSMNADRLKAVEDVIAARRTRLSQRTPRLEFERTNSKRTWTPFHRQFGQDAWERKMARVPPPLFDSRMRDVMNEIDLMTRQELAEFAPKQSVSESLQKNRGLSHGFEKLEVCDEHGRFPDTTKKRDIFERPLCQVGWIKSKVPPTAATRCKIRPARTFACR